MSNILLFSLASTASCFDPQADWTDIYGYSLFPLAVRLWNKLQASIALSLKSNDLLDWFSEGGIHTSSLFEDAVMSNRHAWFLACTTFTFSSFFNLHAHALGSYSLKYVDDSTMYYDCDRDDHDSKIQVATDQTMA